MRSDRHECPFVPFNFTMLVYIYIMSLRDSILILLKLTVLYNAHLLGWEFEVAGCKKIVLRKKIKDMTHVDHNTVRLLKILFKN